MSYRQTDSRGRSMLIPPPEADLSQSPLVGGAQIIEILQQTDNSIIEEVMLEFLSRHSPMSSDNFLNSLCCLYALGLIEYETFRVSLRTQ